MFFLLRLFVYRLNIINEEHVISDDYIKHIFFIFKIVFHHEMKLSLFYNVFFLDFYIFFFLEIIAVRLFAK